MNDKNMMDIVPLPFILEKRADGRYEAIWQPAIPTNGIPPVLKGRSESDPVHAIERLKEKMIEVGLL